uniref:Putative conserved plasma membrane protein n=1 Tax=Ixodes ricinus TaxID=34613 RepID=A0A131XSG5_IXORI
MSLPPYRDTAQPILPFRSPVENDLPPSYDDITNPDAPPPSYQSLFGQVREAHKASNGVVQFLQSVVLLLLGTLGCTILIGVTVIIPFSMVVIGTTYLNDCPAEKYIPIFLVMGGVFGVLKTLLDVCGKCRRAEGEGGRSTTDEQRAEERTWGTLVNCFLFAWYVAGCVWVYRAYPPDYVDRSSLLYCDRTLYLFAFGLVTAGLLSLGLVAACLCCLTLFSLLSSRE